MLEQQRVQHEQQRIQQEQQRIQQEQQRIQQEQHTEQKKTFLFSQQLLQQLKNIPNGLIKVMPNRLYTIAPNVSVWSERRDAMSSQNV